MPLLFATVRGTGYSGAQRWLCAQRKPSTALLARAHPSECTTPSHGLFWCNRGYLRGEEDALLVATLLLTPCAALADEGVGYDPSGQSEFLTNLAGFGYVALLGYFLFKVFTRRARTFTSEVCLPSEHRCTHKVLAVKNRTYLP
jgi:hypothetical protein